MVDNSENQKYCSLYVNDMHLIIMLIPYIEKELEKKNEIVTILENGLENEINTIIERVNLDKKKKEKIKKIQWNANGLSEEQIREIENKIIIIKGKFDFIKKVNSYLEKKNINIVNCFDIDTFEKNSREILESHDAILNTIGIKKIPEIFQVNKRLNRILTK